jgi:hypothetical protein
MSKVIASECTKSTIKGFLDRLPATIKTPLEYYAWISHYSRKSSYLILALQAGTLVTKDASEHIKCSRQEGTLPAKSQIFFVGLHLLQVLLVCGLFE